MPEPRPERPSLATLCARPAEPAPTAAPPLSPPIVLSSVFQMESLGRIDSIYGGEAKGYIYARDGHPNGAQFARKVADIEGAEAGLACGSGMAAEAAILLTLVSQGDHVAYSEGLYGRTAGLIGKELARFGVTSATFDATRPETLRAALRDRTRVVFTETISNPLIHVADLPGLAAISREAGADLVIDHTFAPTLCRPLELGATIVVHSATKLIAGHSDVTSGVILTSAETIARITPVASTFGLTANPFDCWLGLRGCSTLALRAERAAQNALEIARRLESHTSVRVVHYPGLESHAEHALAKSMFSGGFGAMMSFDLGPREAADRFIQRLQHIPYAPSLGDTGTTLSHPTTSSHRFLTPEQWTTLGIGPGLIRLSVGIEDVEDLWADIGHAL